MKKQFKYILCVGLGMVLFSTSCRKTYLTPVPQTSITDATAFDTPARIANQVNSMYQALKSGTLFGGRAQVAGDIRGEDFINETKVTTTDTTIKRKRLNTSEEVQTYYEGITFGEYNMIQSFNQGKKANGSLTKALNLGANNDIEYERN